MHLHSASTWSESTYHNSDQQLTNWLKSINEQRESVNSVHRFNQVDIETFSKMQNLAYNIVKSHFDHENNKKDPLFLMILGQAGNW